MTEVAHSTMPNSSSLSSALRTLFPEVPEETVYSIMEKTSNDREMCIELLSQESRKYKHRSSDISENDRIPFPPDENTTPPPNFSHQDSTGIMMRSSSSGSSVGGGAANVHTPDHHPSNEFPVSSQLGAANSPANTHCFTQLSNQASSPQSNNAPSTAGVSNSSFCMLPTPEGTLYSPSSTYSMPNVTQFLVQRPFFVQRPGDGQRFGTPNFLPLTTTNQNCYSTGYAARLNMNPRLYHASNSQPGSFYPITSSAVYPPDLQPVSRNSQFVSTQFGDFLTVYTPNAFGQMSLAYIPVQRTELNHERSNIIGNRPHDFPQVFSPPVGVGGGDTFDLQFIPISSKPLPHTSSRPSSAGEFVRSGPVTFSTPPPAHLGSTSPCSVSSDDQCTTGAAGPLPQNESSWNQNPLFVSPTRTPSVSCGFSPQPAGDVPAIYAPKIYQPPRLINFGPGPPHLQSHTTSHENLFVRDNNDVNSRRVLLRSGGSFDNHLRVEDRESPVQERLSRSARGSKEELEYYHALEQCQEFHLDGLARKHIEIVTRQKTLRAEVTQLDTHVRRLKTARNGSFPTEMDVERLREENRHLGENVQRLWQEVELASNGQETAPPRVSETRNDNSYPRVPPCQAGTAYPPVGSRPLIPPTTSPSIIGGSVRPPPYPLLFPPSYTSSLPVSSELPEERQYNSIDESAQWNCAACTMLNHPALRECEMCGFPKSGVSVGTS